MARYSDSFVSDTVELFKVMFFDSNIPKMMELGKTKLMFVKSYGIAPDFKNSLKDDIALSPCDCVCFDESLNKIIQECEMDLLTI